MVVRRLKTKAVLAKPFPPLSHLFDIGSPSLIVDSLDETVTTHQLESLGRCSEARVILVEVVADHLHRLIGTAFDGQVFRRGVDLEAPPFGGL